MRQYELAIRISQIHHLIDERKYRKALTVVKTLDMKQVKNVSDLTAIADVYTKTEQYGEARDLYLRIYKKSHTRRILYRLIYLSIKTGDIEGARRHYEEYLDLNPSARDALILRYHIDKAAGAPIGSLIEILEELKDEEYIEEWAYELAKLYHKAGRLEECRRECEDILLWFGHGEIVERAKKLIEYVDDKEAMPYLDDKDFIMADGEEENADDTASLPDLDEYLHSDSDGRKSREGDAAKKAKAAQEEGAGVGNRGAGREAPDGEIVNEEGKKDDDFIDDYEDGFETDADMGRFAKGGLHKLSELLKISAKKEGADVGREDGDEAYDAADAVEGSKSDNIVIDRVKGAEIRIDKERIARVRAEREKEAAPFEPPVHSQSGTGITQDLSREISAIYEAEQKDQLNEKRIAGIKEEKPVKDEAKKFDVIERMTSAVSRDESKNATPAGLEEIDNKDRAEASYINVGIEIGSLDEGAEESPAPAEEYKNNGIGRIGEYYGDGNESEAESTDGGPANDAAREARLEEEEARARALEARQRAIEAEKALAAAEERRAKAEAAAIDDLHKADGTHESADAPDAGEDRPQQEIKEGADQEKEAPKDLDGGRDLYREEVYNSLSGGEDELSEEDLPTTRALHRSFNDILTLISGEPDPSHFVFLGNSSELIVGLSKRIIKVMKDAGFMSIGRIAKINAKKLNSMNIDEFKDDLKGNCLLVDEAAEVKVPMIANIFRLMDEFYGDFVVILADEGNTLDQLFRLAPALAKRFKYIIDISEYTQDDCVE